jgi:hypothetical protein
MFMRRLGCGKRRRSNCIEGALQSKQQRMLINKVNFLLFVVPFSAPFSGLLYLDYTSGMTCPLCEPRHSICGGIPSPQRPPAGNK